MQSCGLRIFRFQYVLVESQHGSGSRVCVRWLRAKATYGSLPRLKLVSCYRAPEVIKARPYHLQHQLSAATNEERVQVLEGLLLQLGPKLPTSFAVALRLLGMAPCASGHVQG